MMCNKWKWARNKSINCIHVCKLAFCIVDAHKLCIAFCYNVLRWMNAVVSFIWFKEPSRNISENWINQSMSTRDSAICYAFLSLSLSSTVLFWVFFFSINWNHCMSHKCQAKDNKISFDYNLRSTLCFLLDFFTSIIRFINRQHEWKCANKRNQVKFSIWLTAFVECAQMKGQ